MRPNTFTISRLAAAADVHVETVRYYQRRRLLRQPERPIGGVRRYDENDVNRLQFIRRAQMMGFSLDEIAGLLEITGERSCEQTRQLTERKLVDVRLRIRELRQLERDLEQKIARCAQVPAGECCPTLDFLERPRKPASSLSARFYTNPCRPSTRRRRGRSRPRDPGRGRVGQHHPQLRQRPALLGRLGPRAVRQPDYTSGSRSTCSA